MGPGLALLLVFGSGGPGGGELLGQETRPAGAVSPDSAALLRASLEQPPGEPPAGPLDVLSVPLQVATFPIALTALLIEQVLRLSFRGGPPNPVIAGLRAARDWGLATGVRTLGPRSGVGGGLTLSRFAPFYLESGISIRGSQRHAVGAVFGDRDRGWTAGFEAEYRRYAEPHFFGIGPLTERDAKSDYRWDRVGVRAGGSQGTGPLRWTGGIGWEENRVRRGFDGSTPDLQERVDPDTLFGLKETTRFVRPELGVELDLTRMRGQQPRGFRAELNGEAFVGVGGTDADFLRWTAELVGYAPVNGRQEFAFRGLLEANRPQSGLGIPFTHLASLGGSRNLRGFRNQRFRDRDLVALMSEWRYEVWREKHDFARAEWLLFYDVGSVTRELTELDLSHLRTAWGFGMRATLEQQLVLLWYLALGGEDTQFQVKFSWPF